MNGEDGAEEESKDKSSVMSSTVEGSSPAVTAAGEPGKQTENKTNCEQTNTTVPKDNNTTNNKVLKENGVTDSKVAPSNPGFKKIDESLHQMAPGTKVLQSRPGENGMIILETSDGQEWEVRIRDIPLQISSYILHMITYYKNIVHVSYDQSVICTWDTRVE